MNDFALELMEVSEVGSDQWETPIAFFRQYDDEYHFTVDAAANATNKKCERFFEDGLSASWSGERVWCNPPYSDPLPWVRKAFFETQSGRCPLVVMLLPVDTSTAWFHAFCYDQQPRIDVSFVKGRLKFSNAGPARFASMVVIYRGFNNA